VAVVEWLRGRGVPQSPAGSGALQSGAPLFALLNSLVHHYPQENADAARMLATMWRLLGPGLDARQRLRACLQAARCHHTLLARESTVPYPFCFLTVMSLTNNIPRAVSLFLRSLSLNPPSCLVYR
jgi:hypothetical protein